MSSNRKIDEVDKNFAVDLEIDKTGYKFYSPEEKPFRIYGVKRYGDRFYRLPPEVAESTSEGVLTLAKHTSGGRVRFMTDSMRIAIKAKLISSHSSARMGTMASSGLDLYAGTECCGSFVPPDVMPNDAYESRMTLESKKMRLITINMPIYCGVEELFIGLDEDAQILEAPDYTYEKPIVYYGSSITQGGCASRPGTIYQNWLSRRLDANYINLGFSGNAKAEDAIADYIASLDMSVFVYDYDHNAPDTEYLIRTHERMFKRIREAHKNLPVLMLSAPVAKSPRRAVDDPMFIRRDVVKATYERALASGDENVWFIPGDELCSEVGNEFTCDHTHPTDLGFYLMANTIEPTLREMLEKASKI